MLSTDELSQLRKIIQEETEPLKRDLATMKQGQAQLQQGQAQIKTLVEALAAGQAEIKETMATKADVQDLKASLTKKINDHEVRISDIEHEIGIPHPHKH